jgi:hypothetical protein
MRKYTIPCLIANTTDMREQSHNETVSRLISSDHNDGLNPSIEKI